MTRSGAIKKVLLGLCSISAWMIGSPNIEREIQPRFKASVKLTPQHQTDRSWQPWNWRKISSIGATQGLEGPAYAHLVTGDGLVVLDSENFVIKRISSAGKISESIEITGLVVQLTLAQFTDLAPQDNGMMWVCNPNRGVIGFLRDGKPRMLPGGMVRAMRLGVVRDRLIVTLANSEQLFAIYTTNGQAVGKFGEFLEEQSKTPLLVDGWITVDAVQQSFFFAPRYAGFLASYNLDGTQRFLVQTVDALALPKFQVRADGAVLYPVLSKKISYLATHDDKLYVLVNQPNALEDDKQPTVLDVYNSKNGSYLFSTALPGHCTEIAVGSNVAYTLTHGEIEVWKPLSPGNPGTKPPAKATPRAARHG